MTTTKEALEPCPLAHEVREGVNLWSSSAGQKWHIWCYDCGLQFEGRLNQPKDEVIKAWNSRVSASIVAPVVDQKPIDMVLFCPRCGTQHIDKEETEAEYEDRLGRMLEVVIRIDGKPPRWTNPPHRSHLCHQCGAVWRPADIATNGVAQIATRGKRDNIWTRSAAHAASTLNDIAAASIRARATTEQTCEWLRAGDGAVPAPASTVAPQEQSDESGWLLEKMHEGNIHYIAADCVLQWTDDPNKALRLARREDAEALCTIVEDCEKIAEHGWPAPASPAALRDEAELHNAMERDAMIETMKTLEGEINAAWLAIERGWEIEPRSYFEEEAPKNGFESPLAMAVHYMWKRETKAPSTLAKAAAEEIDKLLVPLREYAKTPGINQIAAIIERCFAAESEIKSK